MYRYTVPVVLATDDNFAPYCSVAIASIIENASAENFYDIYVFYDSLSDENISKLCGQAGENVSVRCVSVSALMNKDVLYSYGRFSITTYLRLYISEVLAEYDKVIYLDCDIIVQTDLANMIEIDMEDNILGGVVVFRNTPDENQIKRKYLKQTLGLDPEEYINAGVLLINTKAFREENICQKCMETLATKRELKWLDQDILNYACKGRIKYLDPKWNTYYRYFESDIAEDASRIGDFYILHYLDQGKPWAKPFIPSYIYFMEYIRRTAYHAQLTADLIRLNMCDAAEEEKNGENNKGLDSSVIRLEPENAVLVMYKNGELGLKYILNCLKVWFGYKIGARRK